MIRLTRAGILLLALLWMGATIAASAHAASPAIDRHALMALYSSTDGDHWINTSGWETPPLAADVFALPNTKCDWYLMTFSAKCVGMITPDLNNLCDTIPPRSGNLTSPIAHSSSTYRDAVLTETQDITVHQARGNTPPSPPHVGGECEYKQYEGTAQIVSFERLDDSSEERYKVQFLFHSSEPIREAFAAVKDKRYSLLMDDFSHPPIAVIRSNGIEVGAQYSCFMKVITHGTCTPVLFEFPTLDLRTHSDY